MSSGFKRNFGETDKRYINVDEITFFDPVSKVELQKTESPFELAEQGEQVNLWVRLQTNLRSIHCLVESKVVSTPPGDWVFLHIKINFDDLSTNASKDTAIGKHISFNQLLTNFSSKLINAGIHELDAIIDQSLAAFGEFCDVDRCYLFEFSEDGALMSNTHEWVAAGVTPYIDDLQDMPTNEMPYLIEHVTNGIFKVDDVATIPDTASKERAEFERERICSILCVRIMVNSKIYGFIGCDIIGGPYEWKTHDIEYLKRVGEILGNTLQNLHNQKALQKVQIELVEANKQLERLANIDGLTGIGNRRFFDNALECELVESRNSQLPLSLLLIDVDSFKAFNDTYGHVAGDNALKKIAETLTSSCLGLNDLAVRYGGEEFAVILPGASEKSVMRIAEQILRNVRKLGIPHEHSHHNKLLTISIGVVCADIDNQRESATDLVLKADEALYRAKHAGKNCAKF